MPQKIFLISTKSMFENIKYGIKRSSSKSPSIQVLRQQIREGEVLVCADSAHAGGEGGKLADIILEIRALSAFN